MSRLPVTEAEILQARATEARRLLESDDMHYQRAGVRALFCILAMTAESLAHLSADVTDLQRRMDRMRGMPEGEEE